MTRESATLRSVTGSRSVLEPRCLAPLRSVIDSQIGANAVVVKDVPDGVTAVGVPAKNREIPVMEPQIDPAIWI